MVYYTVHCDPLPGKEEELDRFLQDDVKKFWTDQSGIKSFHVYGDKLMGWPERTIMIELEDLATLQRILDSDERKRIRKQFMANVERAESQIQDVII